MIEKLKQLNSTNMDKLIQLEEAMALSAFARNMEAEYDALEIEAPEWLAQSTALLREEIDRRNQAAMMAEIRQYENALEGLKTNTERKTDIQKKLAALQRKVGGAVVKAGK